MLSLKKKRTTKSFMYIYRKKTFCRVWYHNNLCLKILGSGIFKEIVRGLTNFFFFSNKHFSSEECELCVCPTSILLCVSLGRLYNSWLFCFQLLRRNIRSFSDHQGHLIIHRNQGICKCHCTCSHISSC